MERQTIPEVTAHISNLSTKARDTMNPTVHDPVSKVTYAFERKEDDLIVYTWVEPGGALPPHFHPKQVERWSVLDGTVRFRLDNDTRNIGPADSEIPVVAGAVHRLENVSDREARPRCLVSPALHLREFLEESAMAASEGLFTARGRPRGMRGLRWAARFLKRYQEETVMVSPPRFVQRILFATLAREA